jgi:ADP-dependent NAD(P)H-hydrate dehydratase / NAD(P)H-hydrate epimerase
LFYSQAADLMKIVAASEMREIDRSTSERYAVSSLALMENAGTAVAEFVRVQYPSAMRIAVIAGKGNNGGDGFVAARKLLETGREVQVFLLADAAELKGDAAEVYSRLPKKAVIVRGANELKSGLAESDLIVDAILGTGFRPPVNGLHADAIAVINASAIPVVAVDIPSGADSDAVREQVGPMARANAIVTFTAPKPAHIFSRLTSGPTVVAPIGSPAEAVVSNAQINLITDKDIAPLLAPRPAESNKGNYGHVLVIGGSVGKAGAAAMAGMSALRAGAGLSTVATANSVLATVAGFHPEVMTEPLDETEEGTISLRALEYGRMDSLADKKTVLAIGPGISRQDETAELVRTIVGKYSNPIVLDADGLNAFEGKADSLTGNGRSLVITPHPGEMSRLSGLSIPEIQSDRVNVARSFAQQHRLIVVLKGHRALVALPDGTVWVNATGNPGMSTGGTGDILTGMVAGFIAQFPNRVGEAVITAVHLHGLAGDVARESMGEQSLVATDLLKALPEAMRRACVNAEQGFVKF